MVALAECCLALSCLFSAIPFCGCGGLLLFVARSPLACPKVLWKALPGLLRGLTGRYNDQTEKEEEDNRIHYKTYPAVRCLLVSRRGGGGQDNGCQLSSQGCFVRFAKISANF